MAKTSSVRNASTTEEVLAALDQLSHRDESVTASLQSSVASQKKLSLELGRLDILRARLSTVVLEAHAISDNYLSGAALTAKRISSAVHLLDQEQNNVQATLDVVEQVAELKACVLGVHGSMGAPQDWETAASYLSRASKIPDSVIDGAFAERLVPTADVPDPPRVTLENAAESLCQLFLRGFESAAKDGDGARVTRFFKLFPLIGRSKTGLDAYGRYVCQGVAARARANLNLSNGAAQHKEGIFYANALTRLFEHIAQIVDGHERLVDSHYGIGMMVKVIQRLQTEADIQGGIILDTWKDERSIDRKLTDIKSYAFSFLVQSFLSVPKGSSNSYRSESPSKRENVNRRESEDSSVDMKAVDGLLSEVAIMLGRWSLYSRFIASKSQSQDDEGDASKSFLTRPQFLVDAALSRKISTLLISPFEVMTTFFLRGSVEKAFQLDESPVLSLNPVKPLPSNPPYISSAVDDVMYILSQLLARAFSTSQFVVMTSVLPSAARILSADFIGMIHRKMRDESHLKTSTQGALPPEDKIVAFLILMNNLDIANEYVERIIARQIVRTEDTSQSSSEILRNANSSSLLNLFPFDNEASIVFDALTSFRTSFESKSTELLSDSMNVAFHQVVSPRIRPILTDTFRDTNYISSSSTLTPPTDPSDIDPSDGPAPPADVAQRFSRSWTALTAPILRILTPRNSDRLLAIALPAVARILEKRLWGLHERVSEAGAARLERDVAGIVTGATSRGRYALKDAFVRCQQICLVLCFEEEEWDEVLGEMERKEKGEQDRGEKGEEYDDDDDDEREWVLNKNEMLRARSMLRPMK